MSHPDINVHELATQIAPHLPGTWQVKAPNLENTRYTTVTRDDGAAISLYYDSYRGHVRCSGLYPRRDGAVCGPSDWGALPHGSDAPSIKFSWKRSATALARDIERRLLGQYLPLYAECVRRRGKHEAAEEDRRTYVERYATVTGGRVRGDCVTVYRDTDDGLVMGDVHVQPDGDVRIERLYVPRDKAEQILAILGA